MNSEKHMEETVRRYYRLVDTAMSADPAEGLRVDAGAVADITALFDPDAVYTRVREGREEAFRGRDTIAGFFAGDRALAGTHTTQSLDCLDSHTVRVTGTFEGKYYPTRTPDTSEDVQVRFTDQWVFNDDGLIRSRRSNIFPAHGIMHRPQESTMSRF